MIKKLLRSKRGDWGITTVATVFIVLFVHAVIVSVLPVYMQYQKLNSLCVEYTDYIEGEGVINAATETELARMAERYNLTPTRVTYTADYISGTNRIQLEGEFVVRFEFDTQFGNGGVPVFPITLSTECFGRSEQYWK